MHWTIRNFQFQKIKWTAYLLIPCFFSAAVYGQTELESAISEDNNREIDTKDLSPTNAVAEKKLETIRNKLIDSAQKSANRVRSTSYLDENGVLHESTRIESDVVVRGMQVKSYLYPDTKSVGDNDNCYAQVTGYKRSGTVEITIAPPDGRHGTYFLADIGLAAQKFLQSHRAMRDRWLISKVRDYRTQYDSVLSSAPEHGGSYVFRIKVLAAGTYNSVHKKSKSLFSLIDNNHYEVSEKISAHPIEFELSVVEKITGLVVWSKSTQLTFPAVYTQINSSELPESFVKTLHALVNQWILEVDRVVSCSPLFFNVINSNPDIITINGGSQAGIRSGDYMLIANRDKVPTHVLEKDVLNQTALGIVEFVTKNRAELRRVAGPRLLSISNKAVLPL